MVAARAGVTGYPVTALLPCTDPYLEARNPGAKQGSVGLPGVLVLGERRDARGELAVGEVLDGDLLEDAA